MDEVFRIKFVNGNQELEVEGSAKFIDDMLTRFSDYIPPKTSEQKTQKPVDKTEEQKIKQISEKKLSISEFIRKLKFKRHTDMVLGFAYFLEKFSDVKEFSPADINNCYYEAKMESSNTSQMIIQLIRRGHLMQAKTKDKKKKLYTLTSSGIQFIEDYLSTIKE